jgi:hypothetical protein
MKRLWVIFFGLILSGFVQVAYPLEIVIKPGAGFYGDSIGINGGIAVRGQLKNILRIENPHFFSGISYNFSYVGVDDISLLNNLFSVDFGYDFVMNRISVAPVFGIGYVYGNIRDTQDRVSEKLGFALIPSLETKFALSESFKTGVSVGLPILFSYETTIRYVELDVFVSFTFK